MVFIFPLLILGQEDKQESRVVSNMCKTFEKTSRLNFKERKSNMIQKEMIPYLRSLKNTFTTAQIDSIGNSMMARLDNKCPKFLEQSILAKATNQSDGMFIYFGEITSSLTKEEFEELKTKENFYYFDNNNIRTDLKIKNGFWLETFEDGSFSKTTIKWLPENQFLLEFVESNNKGKKAYSRKGDQYKYIVISKESGYYWIVSMREDRKGKTKFKLFFE